jgi:hypothetical protein
VAGGLTALAMVAIAAAAGGVFAGPWLAAAAPISSAMIAAAAAGSVLHWRKVCGRGAVHAAVIATAALVLLGAQFVRFLDVVALSQDGGAMALLRPATWRAALALSTAELPRAIPGLVAVRDLVGPDGVWVFLAVELSLVIGLAWWMAARALASPLCAVCRTWCVRQRGVVERAGDAAAPDLVRQRAAERDWRFFRDLGPARGGSSLRFDLARCPRCDRSNAVSVMWERPLWRDRCLIGDLRVHSDDVRTLLELEPPRIV